ncbi:metallophosphoesterase [Brevibacillus ruminantium]|uniref:Metallophosphoesterase n=1 Tax=Brevibacillus ruminantium TaxID=2950604 RepID=A0ABY4WV26_9BACL|nr:metallophosphoesterase [Brevibacillus ruminantium]
MGLGAASTVYGYSLERHWLQVVEQPIAIPELPEPWKGVRLLHFSDLHLGYYLGITELEKIVDRINQERPDLICFTGDLVDEGTGLLPLAVPVLQKLQPPLGKYAVLGNHDWRYGKSRIIHEALQSAGFSVLMNQHAAIQKQESTLYVAGLDDVLHGVPDPALALDGIPASGKVILLVHEPDYADQALQFPFVLQLSGHSHGGQVRLPILGPLITPPMGQKYVSGLRYAGDGKLPVYTNRGVGTTILPIRFYCRPELTMLTLT